MDEQPCFWATRHIQNRNKRSNRLLTHMGRTMCLSDWAAEYGLEPNTLATRLGRGRWSMDEALRVSTADYKTFVTFEGKTQSLWDWAEERGMVYNNLITRLKRGWTFADAITRPIQSKKKGG